MYVIYNQNKYLISDFMKESSLLLSTCINLENSDEFHLTQFEE